MTRKRVAILGATGYGGGELLRLLLRHPNAEVVFASSRGKAGTPVGEVHRNLHGLTDLAFSSPTTEELVDAKLDAVFGALPHGASAETLAPLHDAGLRVIDLSGDFRLRDAAAYKKWYKRDHPRPDLLAKAVYGCPELNAEKIRGARLIASPGCFATSLNLALLPAASKGLLRGTPVVVGMTGSSGSGAEPAAGTHHPTRAQTIRPYKTLGHQHEPEVAQLLNDAGGRVDGFAFSPISAPLVRGIATIAVAELAEKITSDDLAALARDFYAKAPFVKVIADREPESGSVATTNYAEVRLRAAPDGRLHAVCALDNLVKGGAGQALQCFNLAMGLDETAGLDWPGLWP